MRSRQLHWREEAGWSSQTALAGKADLAILFGESSALSDGRAARQLQSIFPDAIVAGCSTGGQIVGAGVVEGGAHAAAISFDSTSARLASARIGGAAESGQIGRQLGAALANPALVCVLVISDGLSVNGAALVSGIAAQVGPSVAIVGGLAGDGARFEQTVVAAGGECGPNIVAAIGLYGPSLETGFGCEGGWTHFGPVRSITKSENNILYELDGEPALDLYERYLGAEEARDLPASGLLFPLRISEREHEDEGVVRTILGIDRATGSMTFAGDMPLGWDAQLMRGSNERLIDGAALSAQHAKSTLTGPAEFSLMVSCIGRKLLMGQRVDEEVEAAADALPGAAPPFGFYSYGEISPHRGSGLAQLHNQTMTVFLMRERSV
jgi:hypothetical protein